MSEIDPRAELQRLVQERREDYASLSRLLGRNAAYLQQFVKRGVPRKLHGEDRRTLARYFGVSERLLGGGGGEEIVSPEQAKLIPITRLDVRASAGAGSMVEDELPLHPISVDSRWLREFVRGPTDQLSFIRVQGDSMEPTLSDGEDIMVDRSDAAERLRDGLYVLRLDDTLMVKRLAINPVSRLITIRSDNPAYPSWPDCKLSQIAIIGRAVWAGRKLG